MSKKTIYVLLGLLLISACATAGGGDLEISDVWGRPSPMAAENGAFYLTISNGTDREERLLAAASDACGVTELHEMYMKEDDVMGMRPVPDGYITIPAGDTVRLEVGGLHVMCLAKQVDFAAGAQIPLVLTFANAGERTVTAEIREGVMAP